MAPFLRAHKSSAVSASFVLERHGRDLPPLEQAPREIRCGAYTRVGRRPGTFVDVIVLVRDER